MDILQTGTSMVTLYDSQWPGLVLLHHRVEYRQWSYETLQLVGF